MDKRSSVDVVSITLLVLGLTTFVLGGILFSLYWLSKGIFNLLAWIFMFPGTKYSGDVVKPPEILNEEVEETQITQEEKPKTRLSAQEAAYVLKQVTRGYDNPSQINESVREFLKEGEI